MSIDPANVLAILVMAIATYATRIAGVGLLRLAKPSPVMQAALDAVPVAILTAVIAPTLVKGGPADLAAAAITVVAAFRLPLLAAIVIGVGSVVVLRAWVG